VLCLYVCEAEVERLRTLLQFAQSAWNDLDKAVGFLMQKEARLISRMCVCFFW